LKDLFLKRKEGFWIGVNGFGTKKSYL